MAHVLLDLVPRRREAEKARRVLHVAAMAVSSDADGEHAACHVHQQDWGVPIRIVEGGTRGLTLVLSGRT